MGRCFTEGDISKFAWIFGFFGALLVFSLSISVACGMTSFWKTTSGIYRNGGGLEVALGFVSFMQIRSFSAEALNYFLWKKGLFPYYSPVKQPLGESILDQVEYIPDHEKIKHAQFGIFIAHPVLVIVISLAWFFFAKHFCN